jgi:flagellar biosynthesis/type III secretory pathway chaperone
MNRTKKSKKFNILNKKQESKNKFNNISKLKKCKFVYGIKTNERRFKKKTIT